MVVEKGSGTVADGSGLMRAEEGKVRTRSAGGGPRARQCSCAYRGMSCRPRYRTWSPVGRVGVEGKGARVSSYESAAPRGSDKDGTHVADDAEVDGVLVKVDEELRRCLLGLVGPELEDGGQDRSQQRVRMDDELNEHGNGGRGAVCQSTYDLIDSGERVVIAREEQWHDGVGWCG